MELVHWRISNHRNMIPQWRAKQRTTAWAAPKAFGAGKPSLLERVRVAVRRVLNELHAALHKNEWRWE